MLRVLEWVRRRRDPSYGLEPFDFDLPLPEEGPSTDLRDWLEDAAVAVSRGGMDGLMALVKERHAARVDQERLTRERANFRITVATFAVSCIGLLVAALALVD